MKKIESTFKVYDNCIEISPNERIEDNYVYEIKIKKVSAFGKHKTAEDVSVTVCTKLTPAYCTLEALNSLAESFELPAEKSLYYIRDASRLAEYITKETYDEEDIPFEVSQFAKYRAAHDSLLKYYIERSSDSGVSGTIGEISFQSGSSLDAIKDLLSYLKSEAAKWEEHLKGNGFEGRARPKGAVRSKTRSTALRPYVTSAVSFSRGLGR